MRGRKREIRRKIDWIYEGNNTFSTHHVARPLLILDAPAFEYVQIFCSFPFSFYFPFLSLSLSLFLFLMFIFFLFFFLFVFVPPNSFSLLSPFNDVTFQLHFYLLIIFRLFSHLSGQKIISFEEDSYYSYRTMQMTSVRHWGEYIQGVCPRCEYV